VRDLEAPLPAAAKAGSAFRVKIVGTAYAAFLIKSRRWDFSSNMGCLLSLNVNLDGWGFGKFIRSTFFQELRSAQRLDRSQHVPTSRWIIDLECLAKLLRDFVRRTKPITTLPYVGRGFVELVNKFLPAVEHNGFSFN
jgi:hypothetical protein